ncbi:MAG: RtcB family protein [Actinobacteria bacterium]|nr:RtcB family protein [Actinomycetota bacterium]
MEPERVEPYVWRIAEGTIPGMRVPGIVYASEELIRKAVDDRAVLQVANVATLPGIVRASYAMPDIHWGYGFAIGEVKPRIQEVVLALGRAVPRGVGAKGRMRLSRGEVEKVLLEGVRFPLAMGIGTERDAEFCEDGGVLADAKPEHVSDKAVQRGAPQLGSLGAGNHFLEVQVVEEVFDARAANVMGLFRGQVCVMVHTGSRGLGHQVCTDHLKVMDRVMMQLGIEVPDRQLACVPLSHEAAERYLGAMRAGANFARANRHVLTDGVREAFQEAFGRSPRDLGLEVVYDVAHNLAKLEEFEVDGRRRTLCVHRKGATRAFGPGHPEIPAAYRDIGQPVIIPGSMGTASYVLVGTAQAAERSFSSTCHGAGRAMSRTKARKLKSGPEVRQGLEDQGITLAAAHWKLLAEEAPYAYKDVTAVVDVCEGAGLSRKVARLRPVGVVKG